MATLKQLAKELAVDYQGNGDQVLTGVATLSQAQSHQVSFLANPQYRSQLQFTKAGAVVLSPEDRAECPTNAIIADNPKLVFARIMQLFFPKPIIVPKVHPSVVIGEDCVIPDSVYLGPNVVLGKSVKLGERVVIHANVVVGDECQIGEGSELRPQVSLYPRVIIGRNALIHSGVVIGSDGFGFANENGQWRKMPQVGGVIIGNEVEIGANTTIDCGAIDPTVIGNGVILDNLIQIAHNVEIGDYTAIAACVGIAGSAKIGRYCMIGGGSNIGGHLQIVDGVQLTGLAMVISAITEPGIYASGLPALPFNQWKRVIHRHAKLDELSKTIKLLERRFEQFYSASNSQEKG